MLFRSAVDIWFYLSVLTFPLVAVRVAAPMMADAKSTTVLYLIAAAVMPLIVLPAWLLFSTHYQVDPATLRVQAGPFSWAIARDQIHDVTPVSTVSASPALSRDRLKITYGRQQSIVVSPQRKVAFLEALGYRPAAVLQPRKQRPNPFSLGENY